MVSGVRGRCCSCVPVGAAHTRSAGSRCHVVVGVESTKHVLKVDRVWRHTSCAARRQTRMPLAHRGLRTSTSHRMKPKDRLATTAQGANKVGQKHITPCACQPLDLRVYRWYEEPAIRSFLLCFVSRIVRTRFFERSHNFVLTFSWGGRRATRAHRSKRGEGELGEPSQGEHVRGRVEAASKGSVCYAMRKKFLRQDLDHSSLF
jgi:hypothetical protein